MQLKELLSKLGEHLSADIIFTDEANLLSRSRDWWPLEMMLEHQGNHEMSSPPLCVVRPTTSKEVSILVGFANQHSLAIVPYGGGSGVCAGAKPPRGALVLDCGRLNKIIEVDDASLLVRAQAGVVLADLETHLAVKGLSTGHFPQSIDLATVGGLVATRSSGQYSNKYGGIEDMVVGMEAVTASGEQMRVKESPRHAVGPNLLELFIGSEGTFGVITEVTLRIHPAPKSRAFAAYLLPNFKSGLEAVRLVMRAGWNPAVLRLYDPVETVEMLNSPSGDSEALLIFLSEGDKRITLAEQEVVGNMVEAQGGRYIGDKPAKFWHKRRNDRSKFERAFREGMLIDTIEVSAKWRDAARLYDSVTSNLRLLGVNVVGGHSSHSYQQGTNFYFTIRRRVSDISLAPETYDRIWSVVMEATLNCGGSICHHHGIGKIRTPWMERELGAGLTILKRIKQALDPTGTLNPGTLFPSVSSINPTLAVRAACGIRTQVSEPNVPAMLDPNEGPP